MKTDNISSREQSELEHQKTEVRKRRDDSTNLKIPSIRTASDKETEIEICLSETRHTGTSPSPQLSCSTPPLTDKSDTIVNQDKSRKKGSFPCLSACCFLYACFRKLFVNDKFKRRIRSTTRDDKEEKRDQWANKTDFVIVYLAITIGMGEGWRIVRGCLLYDVGSFLFAFVVISIFIGFPVACLEVSLGQFMRCAGMKTWNICPLLKGASITSGLLMTVLLCYHGMIASWVLYYIFASFNSVLPWQTCDNSYNTPSCMLIQTTCILPNTNHSGNRNNSIPTTGYLGKVYQQLTNVSTGNSTNCTTTSLQRFLVPILEFWERKVLYISKNKFVLGDLRWEVVMLTCFLWGTIALFLIFGGKFITKMMYISVTVPYLLMIAIIVRVALTPTAKIGLNFFFKMNVSHLVTINIWSDAAHEVFFTFSLGLGILPVLGSYNAYFYDSIRDTVIVVLINIATVFGSSIFIYAMLGETVLVNKLFANSGPAIMFTVYPQILLGLPLAPMWSCLFYSMIFLLAIDYQIFGTFTVISAIVDHWPKKFQTAKKKASLTTCYCALIFIVGLPMCTQGGRYVYTVFVEIANISLMLLICALETVVISWIYGIDRFIDNVTIMTGHFGLYKGRVAWKYTTPLFLVIIVVYDILMYHNVVTKSHRDPYELSDNLATVCGWVSTMLALAVPAYACMMVLWDWEAEKIKMGHTKENIRVTWKDRHQLIKVAVRLVTPILPYRNQRRLYDRVNYTDVTLLSSETVLNERCLPSANFQRANELNQRRQKEPDIKVCASLRNIVFNEEETSMAILSKRRCDVFVNIPRDDLILPDKI